MISYRGRAFPESVKYWLRPEIDMLIKRGRIRCDFETVPISIAPDHVALRPTTSGDEIYVPTDEVLLMIGYCADMTLFELAGVTLEGDERKPVIDEDTMETDVPGIYVVGTASAGTQSRFSVFLENCHVDVDRVVAALTGAPAPRGATGYEVPET